MRFQELFAAMNAGQRTRFAKRAGTTVNHLAQLAGRHRRPSARMAMRMVTASRGVFPKMPERWLAFEPLLLEANELKALEALRAAAKEQRA